MSCPEFETLSAYADGEAGGEETRRLEGHLAACPSCDARLRGLRAAKSALAALPSSAMPADLRLRLLHLSAPASARDSWFAGLLAALRRPAVALPAAAALGLALFLWARGSGLFSSRVDIPLDLLLAAHHQYALTLPLAPQEKIMSEMPMELAQGSREGSNVY